MKPGVGGALLCLFLLAGCGEGGAAPSQAADVETPQVTTTPVPIEPPEATRTAMAAQATFVAARATVTASAGRPAAAGSATAKPARTFVAETPGPGSSSTPLPAPRLADIGRGGTVLVRRSAGGYGSGIYLGGNRVLTAGHVASGSGSMEVEFDGRKIGDAQPVAVDVTRDLALLAAPGLDSSGAKPIVWGDSARLRDGDLLVAVGYPAGIGLSVSQGIVSSRKQFANVHLVQTDAAMNGGNSGGPLLDGQGQLVAVAAFGICRATGLNFAIASETARPFVDHPQNSAPTAEPLVHGGSC